MSQLEQKLEEFSSGKKSLEALRTTVDDMSSNDFSTIGDFMSTLRVAYVSGTLKHEHYRDLLVRYRC
jgi:hypothetical protein